MNKLNNNSNIDYMKTWKAVETQILERFTNDSNLNTTPEASDIESTPKYLSKISTKRRKKSKHKKRF